MGRALLCSYHVPQADLDSSSRRLLHFAKFLLEDGWAVTAAVKNAVEIERESGPLRQEGVPVYPLVESEVRRLLRADHVDVVILAFWHVAERIVELIRRESPETRIVVDSMDLHFLREARRTFTAALRDGAADLLDAGFALDAARELNVYAAADLVLTVSEKEAGLVDDIVGQKDLAFVVPDCEDLDLSPFGFAERRGMVFVGNFEHPPNADAVRFLCEEILPNVDPALLAEHPLRIVGNDLHHALPEYGAEWTHVETVGWVPSVAPYLERARISLLPLRFGAGTKRKLIQSLMVGTPAVTTSIGAEGLAVSDGEQVLVADRADRFSEAITRLLGDAVLWERLAARGRELVCATRGVDVGRASFLASLDAALSRSPKRLALPALGGGKHHLPAGGQDYRSLVRRLRRTVSEVLPGGATAIVVSRGDPELVALDGRIAWHFPQTPEGVYAGSYPADSRAAVAHLEELRGKGAQFLVLPSTAFWWLDHYQEFGDYLQDRYPAVLEREDTCLVFDLRDGDGQGGLSRSRSQPQTPREASNGLGPAISVVIPTFDRAAYLAESLQSLAAQRLEPERFEVVVVDDGSTDATAEVCAEWLRRLQLTYRRTSRSGIAAAKNEGVDASTAPIVLFFDDDDVADRDLLTEHVRAHEEHPGEGVAVLGYTGWAPTLAVTELMRFVTDVGHYLFAYDGLQDGQLLDFTYFWGGRSSCKRTLFEKHGLFRPEFQFGSEDIEFAYRASQSSFAVAYRRSAVQYMNRPVTFDEFCARCERQGASQWHFSQMHPEPVVREWCQIEGAEERWREREPLLSAKAERATALEEHLALAPLAPERDELVRELWGVYWWAFEAYKAKGIVGAMHPTAVVIGQGGRE